MRKRGEKREVGDEQRRRQNGKKNPRLIKQITFV